MNYISFYEIFTFLIIGFIIGFVCGFLYKGSEDQDVFESYSEEVDGLIQEMNRLHALIQKYKNHIETNYRNKVRLNRKRSKRNR